MPAAVSRRTLLIPARPASPGTNQPKFNRGEAKRLREHLEGIKEEDTYKPWVQSMTRHSPNYQIHDVHAQELMGFCDISIRPDIVLCPHTQNEKKVNASINKKGRKDKKFDVLKSENLDVPKTKDDSEDVDVSKIELFGEFKANKQMIHSLMVILKLLKLAIIKLAIPLDSWQLMRLAT
ncbi:hypothetical protein AX17_005162 [Amanita inopinata Kibby_2008]|nr:hypothetical protein AX17_005162 [Amanita inopinata Kibby_2008]